MSGRVMIILLGLLACAAPVLAQNERACTQSRVNGAGTAGATITIDATVGGVLIAEANTSRCSLWINNETVNPIRCAPSTGKYPVVVSATAGFLWPSTNTPILGWQAGEAWKCIRTGATSSAVSTIEGLP
jgi:hypothetical protein